jgi:hypothetical protein
MYCLVPRKAPRSTDLRCSARLFRLPIMVRSASGSATRQYACLVDSVLVPPKWRGRSRTCTPRGKARLLKKSNDRCVDDGYTARAQDAHPTPCRA